MTELPRSCDSSHQAGESLLGTAPRADVWLLLEYTLPWGAQAFEESKLPQAVKDRLSAHLKAIPNSRLQFIQRHKSPPGVDFYIALAREQSPVLYHFQFSTYDALLTLDIPAVIAGAPEYDALKTADRLFLVCVNGKRDTCCALHGLALYRAMQSQAEQSVWQVNHIGGHRFAPTLVCLPHGIYYGRVTLADAAAVIESYLQDSLYPAYCRGRGVYEPSVQAAEVFLRQQTGITGLSALRLIAHEPTADNAWQVVLASADTTYAVRVTRTLSDFEIYETTGDTAKKRVPQFQLVGYDAVRTS